MLSCLLQAGELNFFTIYSRNPERTIDCTPVTETSLPMKMQAKGPPPLRLDDAIQRSTCLILPSGCKRYSYVTKAWRGESRVCLLVQWTLETPEDLRW